MSVFRSPRDTFAIAVNQYTPYNISRSSYSPLLYLVHVETSSDSHARFADVLTPNPSQKIDILSFSFMLPSCVLAVDSHVCFIFRQGLSLGIVHPLSDSELPAICATACKAAVVSP